MREEGEGAGQKVEKAWDGKILSHAREEAKKGEKASPSPPYSHTRGEKGKKKLSLMRSDVRGERKKKKQEEIEGGEGGEGGERNRGRQRVREQESLSYIFIFFFETQISLS